MVLQQVKICHELGYFYSLSSRDLNMVGNNADEWDRFLVIPYRDGIFMSNHDDKLVSNNNKRNGFVSVKFQSYNVIMEDGIGDISSCWTKALW